MKPIPVQHPWSSKPVGLSYHSPQWNWGSVSMYFKPRRGYLRREADLEDETLKGWKVTNTYLPRRVTPPGLIVRFTVTPGFTRGYGRDALWA